MAHPEQRCSAAERNERPVGVSHLLAADNALSPGRWGAHIAWKSHHVTTLRDPNVSTADETTQVDALCEAMINELRELKAICSDRVADAFRAVPRHLFAPGKPLEAVYTADSALVTKRDEHGAAVSLVSSAHIQATMLEQAQLGAGMRVLEIGTGGCNAALIAELVGEVGKVVSVDIDPGIAGRARDCLAAADARRAADAIWRSIARNVCSWPCSKL